METKTKKVVDETTKERMDWICVENTEKVINAMSEPISRRDLIVKIKETVSIKFQDGTLGMIQKRLEPIIGAIHDKNGMYYISDTKAAVNLYRLHLGQEIVDEEIEKVSKDAKLDIKVVTANRRNTGPRYQTYKNLLDIVKIIKSNGNLIRIDDLIEKFKKQSKIRTFNIAKLDDYSNIMSDLGIPFDYSHDKRIGLTELNSEIILAQKYNETMSKAEKSNVDSKKKSVGVRDVLLVMSNEERLATVTQIAKLLYFSKQSFGMRFEDIPLYYKKKYLKDISMDMVMAVMSELKLKLKDENDFKIMTESAKLLNYNKFLQEFRPNEQFVPLVLRVPSTFDIKGEMIQTSTINKVDEGIYEISSLNDERLTRSLMKLIMAGGRILSPSRVEKRILGIIEERILNTEIMIS